LQVSELACKTRAAVSRSYAVLVAMPLSPSARASWLLPTSAPRKYDTGEAALESC
jgi:hypothetical protein